MKKILLFLIILVFQLLANDSIHKVDLYKYSQIVSNYASVNILIDNKVKANEISFYTPALLKNKDYINSLSDILSDLNLRLIKKRHYYFITYKKNYIVKKNLYFYKFKNLNNDDLKFLKNIFPSVKFQFLKLSNLIYFTSTKEQKYKILTVCRKLDLPFLSRKISLTIYSIDTNKLKNYGFELKKFGLSLDDFISFSSSSINFTFNNLLSYQSAINFLNTKGVVSIMQNPVILLTDNKKVNFESVDNIPYLSSTTTVKDNSVSTQQNVSYKDVGLKIVIIPKIFDNYMFLDLDFTSENIVNSSNTPTTSKLIYHNSFKIDNNSSILLSGLNITQKNNDVTKVPLLGYLPFVKPLFNYSHIVNTKKVISILIKVIK